MTNRQDSTTMTNTTLTTDNGSDEQLMRLVVQGNNRAFDILYNRYSRRICGFFVRMLGCCTEEAKDHTQELFTRIYTSRNSYNGGSFSCWLYGAAYNICKNEYRHREIEDRFNAERDEETTTEQPENLDNAILTSILHKTIESLPQVQREVFILRYIEELSTSEVAAITDVAEGTVKSRLYYALATIREKMKKYNI